MLNKRNKRTKTYFLYGVCFFIAVVLTVAYYQKFRMPNFAVETKETVLETINQQKVSVLKVTKNIAQGEKFTVENCIIDRVEKVNVPDNAVKEFFNKPTVARIQLKPNTLVNSSMISLPIDMVVNDLKTQDFDYIKFTNGLQTGQYVDIHVYFEDTGLDYVVAAKRKTVKVDGQIANWNLTDKDRNNINAAVVDAALFKGRLYTVVYVEPENQPVAEVTYKPSHSIVEVVQRDPSIVRDSVKRLKSWIRNTDSGDVPERKRK